MKVVEEITRSNGRIRRRVSTLNDKESKTEQSHRDNCNINSIMNKIIKTGHIKADHESLRYGDFTTITDLHDMQNRVKSAMRDFMHLPSKIRNRFKNDPGSLIEFLNNPDNAQEAYELGLANKPIVNEVESEVLSGEKSGETRESTVD